MWRLTPTTCNSLNNQETGRYIKKQWQTLPIGRVAIPEKPISFVELV